MLSLSGAGGLLPRGRQDRAKTKEVIVAFAAEPRSLLPDTIVDWTTNDQVEHMYDRLVDIDEVVEHARRFLQAHEPVTAGR